MEVAAPPSTATLRVPKQTVERAVNALLKWKSSKSKTQKPQLIASDEFLYLVLTLNKIPSTSRTNAFKIPLPNPIYTTTDAAAEFCLIIDDRRISSQSAKQKIEEEQIPVSKVIKLSKLKSDYKPFEAKRKLCDSYDLFFADKRIIPFLPKVIGRHFYKKKKIPVPIELGRKNWKEQIQQACASGMLFLKTGTCSVVKVAKASMAKDEIVENVIAAISGVAETIPKKWKNVRSFHLKFSESVALPIYQSVPEMKMKIGGGGTIVGSDGKGDGEVVVVKSSNEEKEKENVNVGKKKKKGRIHEVKYMDDMVGDDESGSEDEADDKLMESDEVGRDENAGNKRKKGDGERKGLKKKVGKLMKGDKGLKLKPKKNKTLV